MRKLADALYAICITVWVGGLIGIGYVAVPVLFAQLPAHRSLAGHLAGNMFALGGLIGMACGVYLLVYLFRVHGRSAMRNPVTCLVALMLLLGVAGQFVIQPIIAGLRAAALPLPVMQSPLADTFARWHGASSVLYLIAVVLGLALVVMQGRGRRPA
ncbi:MAG TPA: DUF4149 domain-containing protein [Rhodocyclaceae bacterium]|nr:DUF4149 domain-containing protein [Rhodocyclaceae bacterium]